MSDATSPIGDIDPIVRGLLPGYLERRNDELIRLKGLLADKDFEKIMVLGHNLSGSGGAYGLNALTEIGRRLEMAAADGDGAALEVELKCLGQFLESVKSEFA